MATALSFLMHAFAAVLGALLAFVLAGFSAVRLAGTAASAALLGSRVGGLAMLVPSMWFALFLGAPLGGGFAISVAGESALQFGTALGFAASLFSGVLLGSAAGAVVGGVLHWVRHARIAT